MGDRDDTRWTARGMLVINPQGEGAAIAESPEVACWARLRPRRSSLNWTPWGRTTRPVSR